jgi:hypothetical protein
MKFDAFVCNWAGHEQHAMELEADLRRFVNVRVVNSDSAAVARHPDWHHTADFFTNHWNKALELFGGDVLFQIQADASFTQFAELFDRCRYAMQRLDCGVYAPQVDYTYWQYTRDLLFEIEPDLCAVPQTDCICWAVRREVIEQTPRVDPQTNAYGWGLDCIVCATAMRMNKKVVRDYRFTVDHPRGRGYDSRAAQQQARALLATLPPDLQTLVRQAYEEAFRVRRRGFWQAGFELAVDVVGKSLRRLSTTKDQATPRQR